MTIPSKSYQNKIYFFSISTAFFLFYLVQVPFSTSNSDVILYALRSGAELPILGFAHLDARSSIQVETLPNYHLLHTIVLWAFYHLFPTFLRETIWPAGMLSSICGALAVGITFLIWRRLGEKLLCALSIALTLGLIPSFWNQSTIGEIYTLQLLLILLFLWFFIHDRLVLSAFAFCCANLVSPISGLSFSLLVLSDQSIRNLTKKAFLVGIVALSFYIFVMYCLDINILKAFRSVDPISGDRSIAWKTYKFAFIMVVNLHFFIFIAAKHRISFFTDRRARIYLLALAVIPQLFFVFLNRQFMTENGSFFLCIFWALAYPIGVAAYTAIQANNRAFISMALISSFTFFLAFWVFASHYTVSRQKMAGEYIRSHFPADTVVWGSTKHCVNILLSVHGWHFNTIQDHYIRDSIQNFAKLIPDNCNRAILVSERPGNLRIALTRLSHGRFPRKPLDLSPVKPKFGRLDKIYENSLLALYLWER